MRRSIIVLGAGALLLSSTACGSDSTSSASPAAATTTTSSAPTAAATTAAAVETSEAAAPTGTESTKKVCASVEKLLEGKQIKKFGGELGKMILYKESKNTAKANAARSQAKKELNTLADQFESATAEAKDADVVAAGKESADSIRDTAKDNAFFARIKKIKDVNKELQDEIIPWVTPLSTYCS